MTLARYEFQFPLICGYVICTCPILQKHLLASGLRRLFCTTDVSYSDTAKSARSLRLGMHACILGAPLAGLLRQWGSKPKLTHSLNPPHFFHTKFPHPFISISISIHAKPPQTPTSPHLYPTLPAGFPWDGLSGFAAFAEGIIIVITPVAGSEALEAQFKERRREMTMNE